MKYQSFDGLSKAHKMTVHGQDSVLTARYIEGFNDALKLADAKIDEAGCLSALKNLYATANNVIVHLESQPVVLGFIQKGMPAGWKMFEETTSYASDAIAKMEGKP